MIPHRAPTSQPKASVSFTQHDILTVLETVTDPHTILNHIYRHISFVLHERPLIRQGRGLKSVINNDLTNLNDKRRKEKHGDY